VPSGKGHQNSAAERENKGEMKRKIISRHAFGIILSATYSRFNESNNHAAAAGCAYIYLPRDTRANQFSFSSGDTQQPLRHLCAQISND